MAKTISRYNHAIPIKNIRNTKEVIATLKNLESVLINSDLRSVIFFNRAYLIVTRNINQAKLAGLFDHPKLMDQLEVAFAARYFEALNIYATSGALPGAWARINQATFHQKHPASLSLLLGANAHINYDLPLVLKDIITQPKPFQSDYFKVNKLLKESGRTISKSYYESDKSINFLKKKLRIIYLRPTIWLILHWRTKAWKLLLNNKVTAE